MDLKERIRHSPAPPTSARREEEALVAASPRGRKGGAAAMLLLRWSVSAAALVVFGVLLLLLAGGSAARRGQFLDAASSEGGGRDGPPLVRPRNEDGTSSGSPKVAKDKLLGGLLVPGFDEQSCLSRYEAVLYRKISPHLPSTYLLERLREHEALQKKCGPHTELYRKAVEQLKSGQAIKVVDCNYLVWIAYSGLGNRILTIASTFLYAVLTKRVLLLDGGKHTADLFCEPFPETSWFLPSDFPIKQFKNFSIASPESYGNVLKSEVVHSTPSFLYLHLAHDYSDYDKLFFCEDNQQYLKTVPWLILKSDNYFVPSLFLIPAYQEELMRLFPQRDAVFHHLGRYLFHPSNAVWGMITRYYDSYLARADERLSIQIRVFDAETGPFQHVLDQVLACTLKEHLLPEVNTQEPIVPARKARSKVVLVTSLNSGYCEKFRNMYWEYPTANGDTISFHQPSHEEHQNSDKKMHNMKAWAEIYLLSLSDVMVTSAWSTFGYVAQGLSGLRPWLLFKPENRTAPDPPCRQVLSMEPCFHAPPFYDCKTKRGVDTGKLVPHVRHCEDMSWGLQLVDQS